MKIIVSRHGNTFEPGERTVWVGCETDLPLAVKGREQARLAGEALKRSGLIPTAIYAAPLLRTREYAAIVASVLGESCEVTLDERLKEIDYGPLGGLSTDEIIAAVPDAERLLSAWDKGDVWPEGLGWKSTRAEMIDALADFAAERLRWSEQARPMVVSSNGAIRFLAQALAVGNEGGLKLATGALGIIDWPKGMDKTLLFWNRRPDEIS